MTNENTLTATAQDSIVNRYLAAGWEHSWTMRDGTVVLEREFCGGLGHESIHIAVDGRVN